MIAEPKTEEVEPMPKGNEGEERMEQRLDKSSGGGKESSEQHPVPVLQERSE